MHPSEGDVRVLVVADDHLARAGLAALLTEQPHISVAGQVSSQEYAALGPEVFRADVSIWDLGWEPDTALGYLLEAQDGGPPALAPVTNEAAATAAWNAGTRSLLHRDADAVTLSSSLRSVTLELSVLDPELVPLLTPAATPGRPGEAAVDLTPRETDVLGLVADGLPNEAIAHRLGISEHTVKLHVHAIMTKLGAQSRTEAVTRATRMGLVSL